MFNGKNKITNDTENTWKEWISNYLDTEMAKFKNLRSDEDFQNKSLEEKYQTMSRISNFVDAYSDDFAKSFYSRDMSITHAENIAMYYNNNPESEVKKIVQSDWGISKINNFMKDIEIVHSDVRKELFNSDLSLENLSELLKNLQQLQKFNGGDIPGPSEILERREFLEQREKNLGSMKTKAEKIDNKTKKIDERMLDIKVELKAIDSLLPYINKFLTKENNNNKFIHTKDIEKSMSF